VAERVSLDVPAFSVALGRALHRAGVPVTPERSARFARALALVPPARRGALYWTARATFVSGREQLEAFDRVFRAVFDGVADPADARGDPTAPGPVRPRAGDPAPRLPSAVLPKAPGAAVAPPWASGGEPASPGEEAATEAVLAAASEEERLRHKSFEALEAAELAQVRRLMSRLDVSAPLRRSRRARRGRRGEHLDVRATIRRSLRTGGDPVAHARRRRRLRPRRLVLLCDISGSMESYSRAFLQFLSSAVGARVPAETFVFATRLTRITRPLRGGDPDAAIRRAGEAAPDWSGGTRIGEALKDFNDRHGRRGMARGAVVVIISDGWERGDPRLVAREMERLARLAHRIVWVNPRAAAPQWEPLARGMAAAMPYCDVCLSGHSVAALEAVIEAIRGDD
jgi:uncharacterized protein with von Willebrand factor type A (vWA) domain